MPKKIFTLLVLFFIGVSTFWYSHSGATNTIKVKNDCIQLSRMKVPAQAIGLPTNGATITSATLEELTNKKTFCKALGSIHSLDKNAPDIHFEVNLPVEWNQKALQMGGGGFNGKLVTGLEQSKGEDPNKPTPLEKGYVTFGSDSGHTGGTWDGSFAMNDEALANFSKDHIKKTHDVAMYLMKKHYNNPPQHMYFSGGSNGGRESLMAIQHWPEDYDGVITIYPAFNWTAKFIKDNRNVKALYANNRMGWLGPKENKLINDIVLQTCDSLDHALDGIISNIGACTKKSSDILNLLRKSGLSEAQIQVIKTFNSPINLSFTLANNVHWSPGYTQLVGANLGVQLGLEETPNIPLPEHDGTKGVIMGVFADENIRYMVTRDPHFDSLSFNPDEWKNRLQEVSKMVDATNPDISSFIKKGGKMILVHGTADELVTPYGTIDYYNRLEEKFGKSILDTFITFYIVPGYGHGRGAFKMSANLLDALDRWVINGAAPSNMIAVDRNPKTAGRTRPLCTYPTWPKYNGSGDINAAENYTCVSP
jgi:hypothetical protein